MRPDAIRGNVFVADLPSGMTDEQLAELFDPHGVVLRAHVARDPATGEALGHGLVELAPDSAVEAAAAAVGAVEVGGRRIDARRADPDMSIIPPAPRPRAPAAAGGSSGRTGTAAAVPPPRAPSPPPLIVERLRPATTRTVHIPGVTARPRTPSLPVAGAVRERPVLRLSLPERDMAR